MALQSTIATRSAGNMRAIPDRAPRPSMWATIVQTLKLLVLLVVVTGVGLVAGAFIMSPAVSKEQRIMGAMGLAAFALLVAAGYGVMRVMAWAREAFRQRRQRNTRAAAMPAMNTRGSRTSKTPRAVQALAAAGAAPTEIAWKTGLPVDAVAMLLQISGPVVAAR
jgi:hypothetical protein